MRHLKMLNRKGSDFNIICSQYLEIYQCIFTATILYIQEIFINSYDDNS